MFCFHGNSGRDEKFGGRVAVLPMDRRDRFIGVDLQCITAMGFDRTSPGCKRSPGVPS
jgi:hypothetical protein